MVAESSDRRTRCESLRAQVIEHYSKSWAPPYADHRLMHGRGLADIPCFSVLAFSPRKGRSLWTYASCGMSATQSATRVELHLFAQKDSLVHVETLTVIAHYHATGASIKLGDTVNFGRPWIEGSLCQYGLISRPYLDGPRLERSPAAQFLWLVPITAEERELKIRSGLESLESKFEAANFNYADPLRKSVV